VNELPPAYIEVGQLDIFCNEDIAYALKLSQAGIPVELHVHPGAQHGFELIAPASKVAQRRAKIGCGCSRRSDTHCQARG
jgi:acetyl esterase/lipase